MIDAYILYIYGTTVCIQQSEDTLTLKKCTNQNRIHPDSPVGDVQRIGHSLGDTKAECDRHFHDITTSTIHRPISEAPGIANEDNECNDFDGTNPELKFFEKNRKRIRVKVAVKICQGPTRPSHNHHNKPSQGKNDLQKPQTFTLKCLKSCKTTSDRKTLSNFMEDLLFSDLRESKTLGLRQSK